MSKILFARGIQYLNRLRLQHRSGRKQRSQRNEATNATLHKFRTCPNGLAVPNILALIGAVAASRESPVKIMKKKSYCSNL